MPQHATYPNMEDEKEKKMCFSMAYIASFLSNLDIPRTFPMTILGDIQKVRTNFNRDLEIDLVRKKRDLLTLACPAPFS